MSNIVDDRLCILHADSLLDCQLFSAQTHIGDDEKVWNTSNGPELSVLSLTQNAPIVGRLISLPNTSESASSWTMLEIDSNSAINEQLRTALSSSGSNNTDSNSSVEFSTLVLAVPRNRATLAQSGVSLMKALASKYLSSQELKDARYSENASLSSSGSSWQSATSTTVDQEGVQVIGAMGGKSIEFHKPKAREDSLGVMTVNLSVCQQYPDISLHNSNVSGFIEESFVQLSLAGLKSLDLSSNFLRSFSRDINPLLAASSNTLTTLNLSSNPIAPLEAGTSATKPENIEFFKSIETWLPNASTATLHIFARFETGISSATQAESAIASTLCITMPNLFAAASLSTIVLNKTEISWLNFVMIASSLPSLTEAHACFNGWTSLLPEKILVSDRPIGSHSLRILNLDGNKLVDFGNVARALESFTELSKLVLTSNPISSIPALQLADTHPFSRPRVDDARTHHWSVSLSSTRIADWDSVRNLSRMFPDLQEIRFQRNPMQNLTFKITSSDTSSSASTASNGQIQNTSLTAQVSDPIVRSYVVSICPHVNLVNGSNIGPMDRKEAERQYLFNFFTTFSTPELQAKNADPQALIEEFAKQDETVKRLWNSDRENCLEAFQRALPSKTSAATASSQSSGILMLDVTICDENAEFMLKKKLPGSTSIGKLRSLVFDALFASPAADKLIPFELELMQVNFTGPPSFHRLTLDQSTLAQESALLKLSIIIRPKNKT